MKSALDELVSLGISSGYFTQRPVKEDVLKNNEEARSLSSKFFTEVCSKTIAKCIGGNTCETPVIVNICDQNYIIPNNSKFYCCDVKDLEKTLPTLNQFDFILLDPPWWNKYIRRRKSKNEAAG